MIGAVGQHSFVDAAVILKVRLAVACEICRAGKYRAFDRHLEESGRPRFVVRIDGIVEPIILRDSNLNGTKHGGWHVRTKHQTSVSVSPIRIVPGRITAA